MNHYRIPDEEDLTDAKEKYYLLENKKEFNLLRQDLELKLHELEGRIVSGNRIVESKLDDKVSFKIFVLLIALVIGNLGFNWAVYEKVIAVEFKVDKQIDQFGVQMGYLKDKINDFKIQQDKNRRQLRGLR